MSFRLFNALGTQWRVGFSGCTGLDYNVLDELWQRFHIDEADRDYLFADIQIMEAEALLQMRKNHSAD